jgi:hypothetical protein
MAAPIEMDMAADRHADFLATFAFLERDFTGYGFKMEIRAQRDTGASLLTLTGGAGMALNYQATATAAAHVAANAIGHEIYGLTNPRTGLPYISTDVLPLAVLGIGVGYALIDALPPAEELGDDQVFYQDILATLGAAREKILRGRFFLRAGVTAP